jgi:prepilin-type N-terminal cleavage/methylation domain-containing protein
MNNKVKAFTLMEITVTMLIAALVISIAYSAYLLVGKSFLSYTVKQDEMADVISLERLIKKDLDRAGIIRKAERGISLRDTNGSISYQFLQDRVIRQALMSDTFKVRTENVTVYFEQHAISSNETDAVIDEIAFDVLFRQDILPFRYHKTYSSAELFVPAGNQP